jgi:hypothetical protein
VNYPRHLAQFRTSSVKSGVTHELTWKSAA